MTWVKIDDGFYQHPKLVRAGPVGMALQIAALCYCNRNLTDGYLPEEAVPLLIAGGMEVVPKMLELGLWGEVVGGYRVHDYLEYQPSREQVEAARKANAERVRRWRNGSSNGDVTPLQTDYERISNTTPVPVPSNTTLIDIDTQLPSKKSSNVISVNTKPRAREILNDGEFIKELRARFYVPEWDYEVEKWLDHVKVRPPKGNYKNSLRNWMERVAVTVDTDRDWLAERYRRGKANAV